MPETMPVPLFMRRDRFEPAAELTELSAEAPLTKLEKGMDPRLGSAWLVTDYSQVRKILGDPARFRNGDLPGRGGDEDTGNMLLYDPPRHTRLRRVLMPEFTVQRMRRLQPRIEEIVAERLDIMHRIGPPADLVKWFAAPVPGLVMCELLGVPRDDLIEFERRSIQAVDERVHDPAAAEVAQAAWRAYMAALVARQRKEPTDCLMGRLVSKHGEELSDEELTGIASLLMLAGLDNMVSTLSLGTLLLLRHPETLAQLRDSDDPVVLERVVEEMLRYLAVVHATSPRTAFEDVTLAGQEIKVGERVICSLPVANRDTQLGDDMSSFDPLRKPRPHLTFGYGIHRCIGAPLARVEMQATFRALLRQFPDLRLAVPYGDVPFRHFSPAHGLRALPVTW